MNAVEVILERLKHRLLDLTSRNRLLNYKHPKGTSLRFEIFNLSDIYTRIVDEQRALRIDGVPTPNIRPRPDINQYIKSISWRASNELPVISYEDTLISLCRKIEREANSSITETGTNTLFLILGFLEYQDSRDSSIDMLAPLVCVPVRLERRDFRNNLRYFLASNGEEIQENLSLREKLIRDFNISLPEFDVENFSLDSYLKAVELSLSNHSNFSVLHTASLGILSFSGMLMIKDLDLESWNYGKNENRLKDHPVLRELFGNIETDESETEIKYFETRLHDVDDKKYSSIPLVYDADHSQHSALIDVLKEEKNLVIQGPPGTGKSQTITNIIAGALDQGKSVLFVSEKLAALEVVKHRLDQVGLAPLILELHSDKANKRAVIESIEHRFTYSYKNINSIDEDVESLHHSVEKLNSYSKSLSEIIQEPQQLSLHTVLWRFIRLRDFGLPDSILSSEFEIRDAKSINKAELTRRLDHLYSLAVALDNLGTSIHRHPFTGFYPTVITPNLKVELVNTIQTLVSKLENLSQFVKNFDEILDFKGLEIIEQIPNIKNEIENWLVGAKSINNKKIIKVVADSCKNKENISSAKIILSSLVSIIENYKNLYDSYEEKIEENELPSQEELETVNNFNELCENIEFNHSLNELESFGEEIKELVHHVEETDLRIKDILNSYDIRFEDKLSRVKLWIDNEDLLLEAPIESYHKQSKKLCQPNSLGLLRILITQVKHINDQTKSLSKNLYLDYLPTTEQLGLSIRTLRAGTQWYRNLSSDYRKSIKLHKSLDRNNRPLKPKERLAELEKVSHYIDSKATLEKNPAWDEIVGAKPDIDFDLDSLYELSEWNRKVSDVIGIPLQSIDLNFLNALIKLVQENKARLLLDELESLHDLLLVLETKIPSIGNQINQIGYQETCGHYLNISEWIDAIVPVLENHNLTCESISEFSEVLNNRVLAENIKNELEESNDYSWLEPYFNSIYTDTDLIELAISSIEDLLNRTIPAPIVAFILSNDPVSTATDVIQTLKKVQEFNTATESFSERMNGLGRFNTVEWMNSLKPVKLYPKLDKLKTRGEEALSNIESIHTWENYWQLRESTDHFKVEKFAKALETNSLSKSNIKECYEYSFYNSILNHYYKNSTNNEIWYRQRIEQLRNILTERDKKLISIRGHGIASKFRSFTPKKPGISSPFIEQKTEFSLVNHLRGQVRPRYPIRKLLQRAPITMQQIKPCFMMSPQSVVKYLAPNEIEFDLLVMDEASQLRPEEAISSVVRAKQVVVVGDSKQLPPTSFFQTAFDDTMDGEDEGGNITDVESILEVGARAFGNIRSLGVHYRSRHHTLIALPNQKFYDNRLIVFPSPYELNSKYGARAIYIANAYYDNGINQAEALKVVDLVVDHIKNKPTESLGVVAVNIRQRDLIDDLLDNKIASDPELIRLRDEMPEKLFVKNLENVQGDERDVIIVSTTYGPNPKSNTVHQRFGPIGYENGWRRLNVLFTRARNSLILCTSLRPSDINVDENSKLGVKVLKSYLEYVFKGCSLDAAIDHEPPDSAFEESVIQVLESEGYSVVPQLGAAGYRIDIAVRHPQYEGIFLAAIECDGATYHTTGSARERDRIRQEVLEQLGWKGKIWRIWSTDWFNQPIEEKRKLLEFLKSKLEEDQELIDPVEPWQLIEEINTAKAARADQTKIETSHHIDLFTEELSKAILESEIVEIGDSIVYRDLDRPEIEQTATIVRGSSDTSTNKYKFDTPFANAVLGSSIGDIAELHLQNRIRKFEILKINKPSFD